MNTQLHRSQCFDFSLDAQDFRQRLAEKLGIAAACPIELDDDDLACLNAAGNPFPDEEEPLG